MPSSAQTIELVGLRKSYDSVEVLRGINLRIEPGEFLVLVGPSGCGKSTLLRCIAGLEEISSGELRLGDERANDLAPRDRDVAMVFQSYALYPHMTVSANLGFSLRVRKMPAREIEARVQDVAKRLGLEDLLHRYPKALSGGQRQRVAVGRAIVRQPRAFLFDEPLSNLDASLRTQLRVELKRLHQELGTTMIYVTHDQVEAMTLADRIAVLKDGTLQQLGTPTELFQRPANRFVAGFIGAPNMNFLEGEVGQDGGAVRGAGFSLRLPAIAPALHGAKVCVGFRPSAVRVVAGEGDGGDLQGEMEVVEVLGWAAHLHLRVASGKIVAQIPAQELGDLAPGSRVELSVAPEDIHLFHAETGASLRVEDLG